MPKITPFLWFDDQAEEAAEFYCSVFPDSRIVDVTRRTDAAPGETGTALVVSFELDGTRFIALNGGPSHQFTEAVSFMVDCDDQDQVDHYWSRLGEGGTEDACGWLKDRFGLSWQIVPTLLPELLKDPDREKADRVMRAMLQMSKIEIAPLETAARGEVRSPAAG